MTIDVLFTKIEDSYYEREELIAQHRNDLESVVNAMKRYAADHGELPRNLNALVPDYLSDASAFASYDGRTVDYNPNVRPLPPAPEMPWSEIASAPAMIAYEEEMEQYWGPELLDPAPIVTMEIPPLEVVFHGSTLYGVYQEESGTAFDNYQGDDPRMLEARAAATRASCANNLKQLGLSAKMFQNEHPEERYPAGVFMLYPEFILDPRVLTCPAVEPGVLSYEFVYPAASDAEFADVFTQVTGEDTEVGNFQGRVPFMIETHLCAADLGHNVMFLDGHVEFMTPDRFEAEVGPFLAIDPR
jgi:prepilin-type processing-associated H-X9-DG protein